MFIISCFCIRKMRIKELVKVENVKQYMYIKEIYRTIFD